MGAWRAVEREKRVTRGVSHLCPGQLAPVGQLHAPDVHNYDTLCSQPVCGCATELYGIRDNLAFQAPISSLW